MNKNKARSYVFRCVAFSCKLPEICFTTSLLLPPRLRGKLEKDDFTVALC